MVLGTKKEYEFEALEPAKSRDPQTAGFKELGVTSAPMQSMAYFVGEYCREYNDDFMLCKRESRDPRHCLLEGRKVTRCAADLLRKLKSKCPQEFHEHWTCLDLKNHQYYSCRPQERTMNECVFKHLGLKKVIPDTEPSKPPIHERTHQRFK